jgi:hypothetical protein
MDRVFGIAAASLFAGMGVFSGIRNAMGFILQVIIAILIILCILVIFLFFVMAPLIPLILTMIGILSATIYSANVSGMSESFCVGPDTLVKMENGWKKVSEIQPGDALDNGVVEGVLKVAPPALGSCVSINNVIISKSHLVYYNGWISAGDHPNAKPIDTAENLYCLNTSTRLWEVKSAGSQMSLLLRDWEEIPDNEQFDFAWESIVSGILNGSDKTHPLRSAVGRGLLGPSTFLWTDRIGTTKPITQIKIGDSVADVRGFTKVIGIYSDTDEVLESGPNDSVWNYDTIKKIWTHPKVLKSAAKIMGGYHLVTESGTFKIGFGCQTMLVRDFTEVGAKRIHETYPFIKSII